MHEMSNNFLMMKNLNILLIKSKQKICESKIQTVWIKSNTMATLYRQEFGWCTTMMQPNARVQEWIIQFVTLYHFIFKSRKMVKGTIATECYHQSERNNAQNWPPQKE